MRSRALITLLMVALLFAPAIGMSIGQSPDDLFVQGTVTDNQGEPMQGVNITAKNVTTSDTFSALSTENGTYNITLPSGVYNISAEFPNYTANITYSNVLVEEGLMGLNFTMREVLGRLTGYVTNGTVPIAGATVHLTSDNYNISGKVTYGNDGVEGVRVTITSDGYSTSTYTSSEGNYTLSGVPLGIYTITFSKDSFVEEELQVSLSPFETKNLDIDLEKEVTEDEGFIPGFDLPHSLMVVGMILSLITLILALGIRYSIGKRPGLLLEEEEEK